MNEWQFHAVVLEISFDLTQNSINPFKRLAQVCRALCLEAVKKKDHTRADREQDKATGPAPLCLSLSPYLSIGTVNNSLDQVTLCSSWMPS